MFLLRSSALLQLSRYRIGEMIKLVLNASQEFHTCSALSELKENFERCAAKENNLTSNKCLTSEGYVQRLIDDKCTKEKFNIESSSSSSNVHNDMLQSQNIDFLKDHKFDDALDDTHIKLPGPLDSCNEDLSHIGPNVTGTFNFAKFADESHTIQQLVKLGVELYKLESDRNVLELFLSLDFEKDIKPYIQFLHNCGIEPNNLGYVITKNPMIFKEDMDDLHTRIRYLRAHNFTPDMIKRIVHWQPTWLSFSTHEIDKRLGYFQHTFSLSGHKVRMVTMKSPKLILCDMKKIRHSTFSIKEEMGFEISEMQKILLQTPRVWIRSRIAILETFDYLHNKMQLSHGTISQNSACLVCRKNRLEARHLFLKSLKRNQYDPTKPLYVSPQSIVVGSDVEFCKNLAKASINVYNAFLKTL